MQELIVRIATDEGAKLALLQGDSIRSTDLGDESWASVLTELIEGRLPGVRGAEISLEDARLLPPVTARSRIFCVAQNYPAHAREAGGDAPPRPIVFLKPPQSFVGSHDTAVIPTVTRFFDYEGELGVVVGRAGQAIPAQEAHHHIAGYTIANDGSSRDLQPATLADRIQIDWFAAKSSDHGSAMGPGVVAASTVASVDELTITTRHNDAIVQHDKVGSVYHSIPRLIEFISSIVGLEPGDVILTGTPAGVGKARGVHLVAGDRVEVEVPGVGLLVTKFASSTVPAVADIAGRVDMS
jgi:2-keto-4-pentenoate hydratase/2-oxohepta-3-ene-1,7-dioic acid hydratase in catechol pathway